MNGVCRPVVVGQFVLLNWSMLNNSDNLNIKALFKIVEDISIFFFFFFFIFNPCSAELGYTLPLQTV